jgi:hypothetical protein
MAARNIDPSDAHAHGSIMEDVADEKLQHEVDLAIRSIREQQQQDDDLTSPESRERQHHARTITILNELCGFAEIQSSVGPKCGEQPGFVAGSATVQMDADIMLELKSALKPNQGIVNSNGAADADGGSSSGHRNDSNSGVHLVDGAESTSAASTAPLQAQCTQEQADALETVMTWLRADTQQRAGGHAALVPVTPLLLVHGPGGMYNSF